MTISSPVDRKKIRDALEEASNSMTRIEAERDLIKDIIVTIAEDHKLSKKHIRKMIRVYHNQNFDAQMAESEEFVQLYEDVVNSKSPS